MIKTEKINKFFEADGRKLHILRDIDLEIHSGEFVAIVGKSGSGKSTLISILSGLDSPSSGKIWLDGESIESSTEEDLTEIRRKKIGFVFQNHNLIPTLTALENAAMPRQLAGEVNIWEPAKKLLHAVGLSERLSHFPSKLSGGEQQRVSICRALVNNPKIVFADEPTGNLDSQSSQKVIDLLLELRGSRTLIIVTHDLELAQMADRIIHIEDGRISETYDDRKVSPS